MKYPVFRGAAKYLATREPPGWKTDTRKSFEFRAIRKLLSGVSIEKGILDVPCGPGRLFPTWAKLGAPIYGIDISSDLVAHADELRKSLNAPGWVHEGDAFKVAEEYKEQIAAEQIAIISCVRFIYYFSRAKRAKLLKSISETKVPYCLIQYRIKDTWHGKIARLRKYFAMHRKRPSHLHKRHQSLHQIREELSAAGLDFIRAQAASPLSERVYVLCANRRAKA